MLCAVSQLGQTPDVGTLREEGDILVHSSVAGRHGRAHGFSGRCVTEAGLHLGSQPGSRELRLEVGPSYNPMPFAVPKGSLQTA